MRYTSTGTVRLDLVRLAGVVVATAVFGLGGAIPRTASAQYLDDATIERSSPKTDERFGGAVEKVGVDGGDPILVVGAVGAEGEATGRTGAGQAYLVNATTGAVEHTLNSRNESTQGDFGAAVGVVPDVTGDGFPDVVVGAPNEDPDAKATDNAGVAYLYNGKDGSYVETLQTALENIVSGREYGAAVTGIGDMVGGDNPEIVVGAPNQNSGDGYAYVFDGDNLTGDPVKVLTGAEVADGRFGASLAPVGDVVAGDGTPDFVVGAPGGPGEGGEVAFVDGSTIEGTVSMTVVSSPNGGGNFGVAVDSFGTAGDRDVIVGAVGEGGGETSDGGRAYILDGANPEGSTITLSSPNAEGSSGSQPSAGDFGASVSGTKDVNGDGISDVIVGAPGETINGGNDREGRAYVFESSTGSLIDELTSPNVTDQGEFGISVAGLPRPVIGAHQENPSTVANGGRVYTFRILEVAFMDGRDGESYSPPSPSAGADENAVGRFKLSAEVTGATLETVTVENDGGVAPTGVTAIELWASTNSTFEGSGTDTELQSKSYSNSVTFSGFGQSIPAGDIYLFVVVDLASDAGGDFDTVIRSDADLTLSGGLLAEVNGTSPGTFNDAYLSAAGATLNEPPTIDALPDRTVRVGQQPDPLSISVGDEETSNANLTLSANSDNATLVPASGRTLSGPDGSGSGSLQVDPVDGETGTATITVTVEDDGGKTASSSFTLQVLSDVVSANVSRTFDGGGDSDHYRLVALPGQAGLSIENSVSGEAGVRWQAYRDDGSDSNFLQKYDGSDTFTFEAGNGFWLTSTEQWTETSDFSAVALQDGVAEIPLRDGWNVISNPLDSGVSWSAVKTENSGTLQPLWGFDGAFDDKDTFVSAAEGKAYYFLNDQNLATLKIPYPSPSKAAPAQKSESGSSAAMLSVTARNGDGPASTVRVGLRETETAERTVAAPPGRFEETSLRIASETKKTGRARMLMAASRTLEGEGETFPLRLQSESGGTVMMTTDGLDTVDGSSVALIHPSSNTTYDLRGTSSVRVAPEGGTTRLTLAIGTDDYIKQKEKAALPEEVRLTSYPNPVGEQGTIEYVLPEQQTVTLRLYDVMGRAVATPARGKKEAGRHTATLEADRLASGVYFARLQVEGRTVTRKVTVVR
ncbi:MAG: hypothetical protein BRD55_05455 [Bacteroidetes bacterium SW_9_63_38]|nr:MAG: hypothetical protein BRD55_05455 [Bacteroidetes bacterium SW_9_63_38]